MQKHNKPKRKKGAGRNWRVHSSLDGIPEQLCDTLKKMLVENKWPDDFKDHYNGNPRHVDLVRYCKSKGYDISMSAMGRYAKRLQTLQEAKAQTVKVLGTYVHLYLSSISEKIQETGKEILTLETQPVINDLSKARVAELRGRLVGLNKYYAKILTTLKGAEV